ncbi:MAG: pilus assembly protein TadG-related protein [Elusimicrobiota bacterium]
MKKIKICYSHSKGQILPLVALTVLVLSMFSFLVWNLGMLEFNRQKMQTAADAAAISALRCRAAFYNAMGILHDTLHASTIWMGHNIKKGAMDTRQRPTYEFNLGLLKGMNKGGGGAPYLTGYQAARLNGAERSVGTFIKGGRGTGLKGRKMTFYSGKITIIPYPPYIIPLPPYKKKTYNPAYYCRTWENGYRKAQPKQEMIWTAYKANQTFASSLIGLRRPAKAQAIAQAKIYLNVRGNAIGHNGGFPRNKKEGLWGYGPEPYAGYPQFDARLVPARGMIAH